MQWMNELFYLNWKQRNERLLFPAKLVLQSEQTKAFRVL